MVVDESANGGAGSITAATRTLEEAGGALVVDGGGNAGGVGGLLGTMVPLSDTMVELEVDKILETVQSCLSLAIRSRLGLVASRRIGRDNSGRCCGTTTFPSSISTCFSSTSACFSSEIAKFIAKVVVIALVMHFK